MVKSEKYFSLMKSRPELFLNTSSPTAIHILTKKADIEIAEIQTGKQVGILYEDPYILLLRDAVIFPNKITGTYIRIVSPKIGDGTIILPIKDNKILLVNHYRHALRRFSWELPRGFAEQNMSVIENAKREFSEECGISADHCKILGRIAPDSGMLGTCPWVVLVSYSNDAYIFETTESIQEHVTVSWNDALEMIAKQEIIDSFTISALLLAHSQKEI